MRLMIMGCAALAAFTSAGCETLAKPHNDVMVFGTTTKVAIDVSAAAQSGGVPEVTVGYKRNEGVWMPLKANATGGVDDQRLALAPWKTLHSDCVKMLREEFNDRNKIEVQNNAAKPEFDVAQAKQRCAAMVLPAVRYQAESIEVDSEKGGIKRKEVDTYSVFASFGGRGGGQTSNGNEVGAAGQLAQFFATGIAAQRLGENPYVIAALNAEGEKSVAGIAAAEAVGEGAEGVSTSLEQVRPALEAKAAALSTLRTEWTDCPDPATQNEAFVAAISQAKDASPSAFWPIVGSSSSKDQAIDLFERMTSYNITAFTQAIASDAVTDSCK